MNSAKNEKRVSRFLISTLASVAAGIGLLALVGWVFSLPLLASLGSNLIPMAPSTALLFVLYGAALFFDKRFASKRGSHLMAIIVGSLGLAIALPLFFLSSKGIHLQIEHLGLSPLGTFNGVPVGHMSPLAAICFVVTTLSLLASHTSSADRLWPAQAAFGLACLIILISLALMLAYMIGMPILHRSDGIPPALSTSLAFFVLALGLLIAAGRQLWPHRRMSDAASARESYALVLVFVLLALGIVTAGYFYYKNYERQYRLGVERELSSIAQLKVDELVQWRNERLADGRVFYMNEVFSRIVKRYLQNRNDRDATTRIRTWVGQVQKAYDYDLVMLLDAQLKTRYVFPERQEPARSVIDKKTTETVLSGNIAFQDFYRNDQDDRVYLKVLVPILVDRSSRRLIGVLALRIDPEKYLYPLISRWPVSSPTSETLIIRREGNEALFLNELRFQKNTALNLHVSLSNVRMPAVMAALGQEGIVEGIDYRGVPVVADVRAIPGSPWFLVARIDVSEVYSLLRDRLWEMIGLIGVLLFGAAAGVVGVWRHQHARSYLQQYEAMKALNASELRYRRLFEAAKDGILILDADTGVVVDVNAFLTELLGYSHEEFLGKEIWELGFFRDIAASKVHFLELKRKEYIRYDDLPLETAKGRPINVEFVSNVYYVDQQQVVQCNIRDITERKRAEKALRESEQHLRRFYESGLIGVMYWNMLGQITDANDKFLDLIGCTRDELMDGRIDWANMTPPEYRHLDDSSVAELKATGVNKTPFEKEYIRKDGTRIAILIAGAMLDEARVNGVAFVLDITERKRAEAALRESEERFHAIASNTPDHIFIQDCDLRYLFVVNPQGGLKEADMIGKTDRDLGENEDAEHFIAIKRRVLETGEPVHVEVALQNKQSEAEFLDGSYIPKFDTTGLVVGLIGYFHNITELKLAEQAIKRSEDEVRKAKDQLERLDKHLTEVREGERALISREIHDELGQSLTALKIDLNWVREHLADEPATRQRLDAMRDVVDGTVKNVQRISAELRPSILDDLGLAPAIEWYCGEFEKRSGIISQTDLEETQFEDSHKNLAIFRILQEALTNIIRHAHATTVTVHLRRLGDNLNLEIKDDGIGMNAEKMNAGESLGLIGMRERANQFNGRVEILSERKKGTTVRVSFPLIHRLI